MVFNFFNKKKTTTRTWKRSIRLDYFVNSIEPADLVSICIQRVALKISRIFRSSRGKKVLPIGEKIPETRKKPRARLRRHHVYENSDFDPSIREVSALCSMYIKKWENRSIRRHVPLRKEKYYAWKHTWKIQRNKTERFEHQSLVKPLSWNLNHQRHFFVPEMPFFHFAFCFYFFHYSPDTLIVRKTEKAYMKYRSTRLMK